MDEIESLCFKYEYILIKVLVSKCLLFRYDLDNSGAIDKVEMVKVMEAIYSMVDGNMKVKYRIRGAFYCPKSSKKGALYEQ